MNGIESSFGLVPEAGGSRIDVAWAAACAAIGAVGRHHDGAAVARCVADADTVGVGAAADALRQVVAAFGVEPAADRLAPVVADILTALPAAARLRLLTSMDVPDRAAFVRDAAAVLPPRAVLGVAASAAASYDQSLSAPLARLLQKLRAEAEAETDDALRARAEQSFRSLITHLTEMWSARMITSATGSFESMFEQKKERRVTRVTPEPDRIVKLSLESGAMGNVVWGAIAEQSRTDAGMREVFDLVRRAPAGGRSAGLIADQLATPARLSSLLSEEPIDFDTIDVVVKSLGMTAARPLLDQLVEARQRSTRRALMDRLVQLGPDIAPLVAERLKDPRWYVVRNMVSLLREAGCAVDNLPLDRFRMHEDGRVRRETLQLQLEDPPTRESALVQALQDTDKHVLRTALQAARTDLPEAAVPVLARQVASSDFPPEFRVMGLFLLGRSGSIQALETLIAYVHGGNSLFGKPKLAAKSPEMLAALGGLARSWPNDRRAAVLLELARATKDPQILNALKASS